MYQGIFYTDFDKYIEDAIELFNKTGITTVSQISKDGRKTGGQMCQRSASSFVIIRVQVSWEYGEYPYVSAEEVRKALTLKAAFSNMLDQMQ